MKWTTNNTRTRLYLISAVIMLVGLSSALLIYLHAVNASESALLNEFEYSKSYQHDLELYGGKANVLASDLMHWFSWLWQGDSLAFMIAFITILISLVFLFVARHLPSDMKSDARNETSEHHSIKKP